MMIFYKELVIAILCGVWGQTEETQKNFEKRIIADINKLTPQERTMRIILAQASAFAHDPKKLAAFLEKRSHQTAVHMAHITSVEQSSSPAIYQNAIVSKL